jgi:hypothetical protein
MIMSTNDLKVPSIRATSERLQRQTAAVGHELLIASVVSNRSSALRVDANDAVPAVRPDGASKVYGRGNSGEDDPAVAVFTQSEAEVRSRRSLLRVMISSPALARFRSAKVTSVQMSLQTAGGERGLAGLAPRLGRGLGRA